MLKDTLDDIKKQMTTVIDNCGGKQTIANLENYIIELYKLNPFIDSLSIDLNKIEGFDNLVQKCNIYVSNKYNSETDCCCIVGSYLQNYIEQDDEVSCLYDNIGNRLLVKL